MTKRSGQKAAWNTAFYPSQGLSSYGTKRRVLADGGSTNRIPDQLLDYRLIKVCPPSDPGNVHPDCTSPGKRPVTSTKDGVNHDTIADWSHIGNVGVVPTDADDLVILDVDHTLFGQLVDEFVPPTFTVETGSGNPVYYVRCSEYSRNQTFTVGNEEYGSIRANNWHAVIPPSTHPEGGQYTVARDAPLAKVPSDTLRQLASETNKRLSNVKSGGGGGASAAAASSHSTERPTESVREALSFVKRDDIRDDLADVLERLNPAHSRRVWLVGWLHGAAGLDQTEITDLLMDVAQWGDLDRDITAEQVASVIDSSRSGRGTHYTQWGSEDDTSTAYKSEQDERRKMEQERSYRSNTGGNQKMTDDNTEFNVKETAQIQSPSDGDGRFRDVALVEGNDNGETFEFVQIRQGQVETMQTPDGDDVEVVNIQKRNTVGSPDYLEDTIEGLQQLHEAMAGDEPAASDD